MVYFSDQVHQGSSSCCSMATGFSKCFIAIELEGKSLGQINERIISKNEKNFDSTSINDNRCRSLRVNLKYFIKSLVGG